MGFFRHSLEHVFHLINANESDFYYMDWSLSFQKWKIRKKMYNFLVVSIFIFNFSSPAYNSAFSFSTFVSQLAMMRFLSHSACVWFGLFYFK